ncbi:MAG TPA: transglutaminase family protein [Microlunatus sp.]
MGTRRLSLGCTFVQWSQLPVHTVFQVEPVLDQIAIIKDEEWVLDPATQTRVYRDIYGNRCRRLMLPAGRSEITFRATAEVPDATEEVDLDAPEVPPHELPDDVMIYTLPSRFCLPDVLATEAWSRFGGVKPGYGRVQAICDYVNQHLTFQYGSTTAWSTAADVHASGYGVCRDFTHLAVSLCRAMNIPARYVFGYLPEIEVDLKDAPMDFAAWMQVWLGDRWYTFDPRNNVPRKGRVLIGVGRDAADVAMSTAFGAPWLESMVVVSEEIEAS